MQSVNPAFKHEPGGRVQGDTVSSENALHVSGGFVLTEPIGTCLLLCSN